MGAVGRLDSWCCPQHGVISWALTAWQLQKAGGMPCTQPPHLSQSWKMQKLSWKNWAGDIFAILENIKNADTEIITISVSLLAQTRLVNHNSKSQQVPEWRGCAIWTLWFGAGWVWELSLGFVLWLGLDRCSLSCRIQIPSKLREENKLHIGSDINMISGLSPTFFFPLRAKDIEMIQTRTFLGMNW